MLEVLSLGLLLVLGAAVAVVLLVAGVLKVLFKLLLLPLGLAAGALKVLVLIPVAIVLLLVVGPLLLGIGLAVLIPVLILGGLAWGAVHLFSIA